MQVAEGQRGARWGPRVGGKRGRNQRRGQGAESETFRTRTCWSPCCRCVLRGTGQRDHRAPGGSPCPQAWGQQRNTAHRPHLHPQPPSPMQAGEEVGASASPGDVAGVPGCRDSVGGTRVEWGLGDLGKVGRRSPSSCLLRDEGQGRGAPGAAAREERVKTRASKPEGGGFNRRPQSGASWFCGYSPLALTYCNSGLWTRGPAR